MSNTRTAPHNIAEYYLTTTRLGRKLIVEPDGWRTDYMEIKRSSENTGLINQITLELKFFGNGADYLRTLVDNFGTEEECILEKWAMHPMDRRMDKKYRAYLKLDKIKDKDNFVTCKAEESGILSLINTYKGEKIELDRLTSLNGNVLEPLDIKTVHIPGKEVLLVSEFEVNSNNINYTAPAEGLLQWNLCAPPFDIISSSDIRAHSVTDFVIDNTGSPVGDGSTGNMFYADNDRLKDLRFKIDVDIQHNIDRSVTLRLLKFTGGSLYTYNSSNILATSDSNGRIIWSGEITEADVDPGVSYALALVVFYSGNINYVFNKLDLTIKEDSYYPATNNKVLLPLERFERILQIITGRTDSDLLKSDCLGRIDRGYTKNGDFAFIGSSSGFWARNFDDKPFTTTWADSLQSFFATRALGFGVVKNGDRETIIIEPIKFFYQDGKIFEFPFPASNIERWIASEFQYSSIDVGYDKGGDEYEEAMGLDEPNGRHNYTTPFKSSNQIYEAISKDRGDMTGYEFARRKPYNLFPTEDTRYDNENFLIEMKEVDGLLEQITWLDVYEEAPENLFSPNTHTNPTLSPKRNLLHHTFWLNGGMQIFGTDLITNTGSTGNSEMITKVAGEEKISEKEDLAINKFDPAKFQTRWIKFDHKVTASFSKILYGYTVINGRRIPNIYFRFRFINDKGEYELCRIWDVNPKDEGSFKVLKVN